MEAAGLALSIALLRPGNVRTRRYHGKFGLNSIPGSRPESAKALGPLIDPNLHSCGSVPPHCELTHPEPGFYTVGIKSYGRAPTLLLLTGYEHVRSVAAALRRPCGRRQCPAHASGNRDLHDTPRRRKIPRTVRRPNVRRRRWLLRRGCGGPRSQEDRVTIQLTTDLQTFPKVSSKA